mmetsp:Transcript_35811/g.70517  ORF Transcript_35811/g.70517 Transcript_35811/m.70517 type:complete len:431 (-) Transcript_35811:69-1361(-)
MSSLQKADVPFRPRLGPEDVIRLLKEKWGIPNGGNENQVHIKELPSYDDLNFLCRLPERVSKVDGAQDSSGAPEESSTSFVFKATKLHTRDRLEMQHAVMKRLETAGLPVAQVVPSLEGRETEEVEDPSDFSPHTLCRVMTYLEGDIRDLCARKGPEFFQEVGRVCGNVCRALQGFSHPASNWDWEWNTAAALKTGESLVECEPNPKRRQIARHFLALFRTYVQIPMEDARAKETAEGGQNGHSSISDKEQVMRTGVIHSDLNDTNLIWRGESVSGILDFGDAIHSFICFETANAAAYALMGQAEYCDPGKVQQESRKESIEQNKERGTVSALTLLQNATTLFESSHREFPLSTTELRTLFAATAIRILISVLFSAKYQASNPEDEYVKHTYEPGWTVLEELATIDGEFAVAFVRETLHANIGPLGKLVA